MVLFLLCTVIIYFMLLAYRCELSLSAFLVIFLVGCKTSERRLSFPSAVISHQVILRQPLVPVQRDRILLPVVDDVVGVVAERADHHGAHLTVQGEVVEVHHASEIEIEDFIKGEQVLGIVRLQDTSAVLLLYSPRKP